MDSALKWLRVLLLMLGGGTMLWSSNYAFQDGFWWFVAFFGACGWAAVDASFRTALEQPKAGEGGG